MMGFSDKQQRALQRSVAPQNIRVRAIGGKELGYIEGWYAIANANRIFGFDGWDRETTEAKCVLAREARGNYLAIYIAKVRVTVRAADRVIVRDGHGTGEGRGTHPGEAHDLALKAAETDATKRALVTFGKAFGLALYANGRRRRAVEPITVPPDLVDEGAANGADVLIAADASPVHGADGGEEAKPLEPPKLTPRSGANGHDRRSGVNGAAVEVGERTEGAVRAELQPRGRIDKSALALAEPRRVRDKEHLRYVAAQPCLLCSARPSDAHHVRVAQPRALGRKVGDEFTVPLCRKHHRELHHSGNEAAWWHDMGIDAIDAARQLWGETEARR